MTTRTILAAVLLVASSAVPAAASTIVLETGPFSSSVPAASPDPFGGYDYVAASWTETTGFNNVSIAFFGSATFAPASGVAYLTTSFGPGTTVADQIASAPFDAPLGSPSMPILIFSGLDLGAGTYYITIAANPGDEIGWSATNSPNITTAPGVNVNPGMGCFNGSSPAAYPPGTTGECVTYNLRFSVTGGSSVPEPGTFSMFMTLGVAGLAIGWGRRRSRQRLLSILLLIAAQAGAQVPEKFTNLQVLPKTTSKADLMHIMRGFVFAVGVRCDYCHTGTSAGSLEGMNFVADEKETKRTARVMLRMVAAINADYIGKLGGTPSIEVECFTCHRGLSRPRTLQAVLTEALEKKDIPSAIALYRDLKKDYYGGAQYDFSETSLNLLTESLLDRDKAKEAVAMMELNLEVHNPLSGWGSNLMAMAHRANGDTSKAIQDYKKIVEDNPGNTWAKQQLADLVSGKR